MGYYTTYGEFQEQMNQYHSFSGGGMQYPEMIDRMYQKKLLSYIDNAPSPMHIIPNKINSSMSDAQFDKLIDSFYLDALPHGAGSKVEETDIIPNQKDVFVIRHPRFTRRRDHTHNYFEIDYVSSGKCSLYFNGDSYKLNEGELCIVAPFSVHDLIIDNQDSLVFCIMIRKSTFNTTFFSLRSGKDLLSYFFRNILQNDTHSNFLRFFTSDNNDIRMNIRNAMLESYRNDGYSNVCAISFINLMFANLLRNFSKCLQYYDYPEGSDFSLVLQYIQHNYQTLTLSSLATFFHYSEPHICTLIKQNTGHSFTELIRDLRLSDAVECLVNTNKKISEIADYVGYNSADHFSRVFRSTYHMSPIEYRKLHLNENDDDFHPFSYSSTENAD